MNTRRDFLKTTSLATAMASLGLPQMGNMAYAQAATDFLGVSNSDSLPMNEPKEGGRWRPKYRVGFGAIPIGNAFFKVVPDTQAVATVEAAWNAGVRLYDTSPSYGYGLSERRLGLILSGMPRDEFVISSKIGRVMRPDSAAGVRNAGQWHRAPAFQYHYDYSADGTRRSIEDSLQRLGLSQLDVVFVHDLTPGNSELGDWKQHFKIATDGAFRVLDQMKREGLIKGWGLGVNNPEPILAALDVAEPDIMLAATQYSLINHEQALSGIVPALRTAGASIMVGAPLNAGFLSGRERFNYGGRAIPAEMLSRRRQLFEIAGRHQVDLRVAALQFVNANPVVSCVIPGASSPAQAIENVQAIGIILPSDFWAELRQKRLIHEEAPIPA